jgi:hypothetical protein
MRFMKSMNFNWSNVGEIDCVHRVMHEPIDPITLKAPPDRFRS